MIPRSVQALLESVSTSDKDASYVAFKALISITNKKVPWVYDAWDGLLDLTRHGDNHQRAIGVQLLANLTRSDSRKRMLKDLPALFKVTRDPMFVTARHSLLCLWKVGIKDKEHQKAAVSRLSRRFRECISEKNCTLIRYDIQTVLRRVYDSTEDEAIHTQALKLIALEKDPKYAKKYATVWKMRR
jgi:hypothetical protein